VAVPNSDFRVCESWLEGMFPGPQDDTPPGLIPQLRFQNTPVSILFRLLNWASVFRTNPESYPEL